jgi:hypothetical protein
MVSHRLKYFPYIFSFSITMIQPDHNEYFLHFTFEETEVQRFECPEEQWF